jgi:hypothetical protein
VGGLILQGRRPRVAGAAVVLALIVAVGVVQSAAGGGLTPTTSSTTSSDPCQIVRVYPIWKYSADPTTFAPGQTIHLSGVLSYFVHPPVEGCAPPAYSGPTNVFLLVGGRTYLLATPMVTNGDFSIEVVVPLTVVGRGLGYIGSCTICRELQITVVDPVGPPTPVQSTPGFTG